MRNRLAGSWLLAGALALSGACAGTDPDEGDANEKTMFVGPERRTCQTVILTQCMVEGPTAQGPWTFFYGEIEGFHYEPGFVYELRVLVVPVPNPPQDASSLRYVLVRLVSKTRVE